MGIGNSKKQPTFPSQYQRSLSDIAKKENYDRKDNVVCSNFVDSCSLNSDNFFFDLEFAGATLKGFNPKGLIVLCFIIREFEVYSDY